MIIGFKVNLQVVPILEHIVVGITMDLILTCLMIRVNKVYLKKPYCLVLDYGDI